MALLERMANVSDVGVVPAGPWAGRLPADRGLARGEEQKGGERAQDGKSFHRHGVNPPALRIRACSVPQRDARIDAGA
jgi:hypothetical protein